ncbi:MAG: hypothetical protein OEX07_03115 [Gammaproteobacteria bacterium]|nr:hypothetical protein [Gammaproteobacteria bacterium]
MFKRRVLILVVLFLSLNFSSVSASGLSGMEEACYSVSMVGYDTVINSDLGLPLDEVIDSMVTNNNSLQTLDIYEDYLLLVVMEAYNWDGSPHTYAVKTMFQCAAKYGNR